MLKEMRLRKKLSRREVAAQTGLSHITIFNVEKDPINSNTKTLLKLANYYGISLNDIVNEEI